MAIVQDVVLAVIIIVTLTSFLGDFSYRKHAETEVNNVVQELFTRVLETGTFLILIIKNI